MRIKNKACKTADKLNKNHQGNYEISISFDLYGEGNEGDILVNDLQDMIECYFEGWHEWLKKSPKKYKIKNIRWNK